MAYSIIILIIFLLLASAVKFSQLTYSVAEHNGSLQPVLILSNVLSTNITIQILDESNTAIGKCTIPPKE